MDTHSFIVVALALFAFGLVSRRLAATPITAPMAFMVLGVIAGPMVLGWVSLPMGHGPVHVLAELTLVLVLFGDAARIDLGALRKELGIPVRLLGIGLPLTIVAGAVVAKWLLPELSWLECAVLGAVLAPTDAALGQAVVSNKSVPIRIRQALNVESGLNDGIALPAVLVLAALASMHAEVERTPTEWVEFAGLQVTLGPIAGIAIAVVGARALRWANDRGFMAPEFERLAGVALALLAFAVAEQIGGNGFISAFVSGMVLGQLTRGSCEWLYDFLEAEGQLLMLLVFLAFGATLVGPSVSAVTTPGLLYAILSLTVIRMVPVALSLIGTGLKLPTVLFLGWFGPRGLASILFALLVMDETMLPHGDVVFHTVMIAVLLSVVLHGLTAAPFANAYGRMAQSEEACPEEHRTVYTHPLRFNEEGEPMTLSQVRTQKKVAVAKWSDLQDREPAYGLVANVDLVIIRYDDNVSVLYGRCLHRGALMADGRIEGDNLICGVHGWDYRMDTGVSSYNNDEALHRFRSWIDNDGDTVLVDEEEIRAWAVDHPQPYDRDAYLGLYADVHGAAEEPYNRYIQTLARDGLSKLGHHGVVSAMGVARQNLPMWDSLQLLTAQLARKPLLDDADVATNIVIGPAAKRPLELNIPLFVSDMSFGALSQEAKVALSKGAELAGTGICSGEGGMLPEEQENNSRYFYELASARFGWSLDKVKKAQAFHFKGGQGAKTGTGGHLPGNKVSEKIAEVRGLKPGQAAISPSTFPDLDGVADFRRVADEVREATGGVPIGFKISAQHIEADIDFALDVGSDYIILDGRGGATGAAPNIFKDNISVPTMAALARARRHLDERKQRDVTLIITGGLRTESDFVKALALGADGIAVSNAAIQAIGCLGMRACHTNNCPVGIATQKDHLRARLEIEKSANQLKNYFEATTELMQVLARACGHRHLNQFSLDDLTTWDRDMAYLTGVKYAGVTPL